MHDTETHDNFLSRLPPGYNNRRRPPPTHHQTTAGRGPREHLPRNPASSKMWDISVLALLICAVTTASGQSETGKYRVTAPKTFTPGETFTAAIEIMQSSGPVQVTIEIEAYNYFFASSTYSYLSIAGQSATFSQGTPGTLSFKIPSHVAGATSGYRLHVRGTGGLQIDTRSDINLQLTKASVFIQPDRQVYRPGQTVNFRTFSLLLSDLKPLSDIYTVTVQAPGGSLVRRWTSNAGLVSSFSFDLDKSPPLGRWTISASSSEIGQSSVGFDVQEYENPPFSVQLNIPRTMNTSQILTGSVEARYPQGVGVKGTVEVSLPTGYTSDAAKTSFQIDGSANFSFSELVYYTSSAVVTATVTEQATGRTVVGKSTLNTYERNVKVQFSEKTPAVIRPGLPFTAYVQVTDQEDQPLNIAPDSIFRFVYVYGVGHYSKPSPDSRYGVSSFTGSYPILAKKMVLPQSGFFPVELDIPTDVTQVDIRVTFQGVQNQLTLQSVGSSTNSYLQLSLLGSVPRLTSGQQVFANFRATSNKPLDALKVQIVSRGQVLQVLSPSLTNAARAGDVYTADFQVALSWSMAPVTDIVAYLNVGYSGIFELVADSIAFNVEGLLRNEVTLTADRQRAEPGESVTLTVQSLPTSVVGVLVQEDFGNRGNVITAEEIIQKFVQGPRPSALNDFMATSSQRSEGSFERLNLNVIGGTNTFSATSLVRQALFSGNTDDNTAYPDTIFFATNTISSTGSATFAINLPDTVTTWAATAFSFDANGNLGVVDKPVLIEAVREVYAELSGTDHAVTGEHVIIRADVHNTRAVESQVQVTLKPNFSYQGLVVGANGAAVKSSQEQTRTLTIPAKSSSAVYFAVTAIDVTTPLNTDVVVEVVSGTSGHAARHTYTSVPKGVSQSVTYSKIIQVAESQTAQFPLSAPTRALEGSESHRVNIERIGPNESNEAYLPPLVKTNKEMTKEGTGADAVLKLAALTLTSEAQSQRVEELIPKMELAYQRLLAFHSQEFKIFSSGADDTWMSLASAETLFKTSKFITVDYDLIYRILSNFINEDLKYNMKTYSNPLPRRSSDSTNPPMSGVALAAYYAIILARVGPSATFTRDWIQTYEVASNRTREFLFNTTGWSPEILSDTLTTSYLAYATVLTGYDPTYLLDSLLQKAIKDPSSGEIYWDTPRPDKLRFYGDWQPDLRVPRASDVTTASYVLQTLLQTRRYNEAADVANWLLRQRSLRGSFRSPVDSYAATEALLAYYRYLNTQGVSILSSAQLTEVAESQLFNVSLPAHTTILAQVETNYRVTDDVGDEAFETVPVVLDETLGSFKLMVCSRRLLKSKIGPVVQRVDVPSGFVADISQLGGQQGVVGVKRRNDTTITVYFNDMSDQSSCYTLPVRRVHAVAQTAPAYIVTHSFLEPENQGIASYQPRRLSESTVCDFCSSCCTAA